MKIRQLKLHNVRRFANKTAVLGPFGDGLTTITAENEHGKSTFFDALHALFFFEYGSSKKELKEMQPYSGGAMRISAEIEFGGENYRIEKVFNLKKSGSSASVIVISTGVILKQADDAEHWIQQNILTVNNGPFGLLWVRQGTIGVDVSSDGVDARRDIMSSVRGQIDAVTGGRRMDSIVQRCKQDLDTISTKQDKPKAGSQWKDAVDRVDQLSEEHDKLADLVAALSHNLYLKKKFATRLRELQAPELHDQRAMAIVEAEVQLTETREHARKVQEIQKDVQLLQNEEQGLERNIKTITDKQERCEAISIEIDEKESAVKKARDAKSKTHNDIIKLQTKILDNEQSRRNKSETLKRIRQTERETKKQTRLVALSEVLVQLKSPKKLREDAAAKLCGDAVKKDFLDRLSDLERRRDIAIETRKIHFARFTVSAETSPASIDGSDIPSGQPHLIDQNIAVMLSGFGTISLQPAEGVSQGIADPNELQSELEGELLALGVDTVVAAQHAYAMWQKADQDHRSAQMQIRALAPDGIEALESEWDLLCDELSHPKDQPAKIVIDTALGEIISEFKEREISNLDEDIEQLRKELSPLQNDLATKASALTESEVLLVRLQSDQAELAVSKGESETLERLINVKGIKTASLAETHSKLEKLQFEAPDLSVATSKYERAVQADSEDKIEIHRLERELARLDGAVQTQTEGAVEEKLAEVTGKLMRANERATQFEDHVKALRLLVEHLEAARTDAQETYFEPVRNELMPLLRQLHSGADFKIDAEKLLIETITRNGVTDKIDALSGGASEQIAILTRLAFARLFAKQGNHVPIVLDDALVHTDDGRISTMFNMLAQVARDQQIIVLSCRTRAFSDLGGTRAFITETNEDTKIRK